MDNLEFENFEINASDQDSQQQNDDTSPSVQEQAIKFSSSVIIALESKAKEHNKEYNSKVTVSQLKKVYRKGAQAEEKKGLSAMARVNMYLRMKKEGKIVYQSPEAKTQTELKELVFEGKANIRVSTFFDITESWLPIEADVTQAAEDIKTFELGFDFKDVNELYLDDYEKLDIIWG
jgi:hypothetical protein